MEKEKNNNCNNNYFYDCKEDIIKDSDVNYNNNEKEKIVANDINTTYNYLNPLGHIIDNFVSLLKNRNKNKCDENKYCDNIVKKRQKLNNMCLAKTKPKINYTYYNYNDYSYLENKMRNIGNQNKRNIKGKNVIKEQKYGQNYDVFNNNKNNYNFSGIYDNNKVDKFNKYNEESPSKSKKYSTNCTLRDNENNNQNLGKEKQTKETKETDNQSNKCLYVNNSDYINNNIDVKSKENENNINLNNLNDHSNIDLNNNNQSEIYNKFIINDYNIPIRKKNIYNSHEINKYLNKGINHTRSCESLFPKNKNKNIQIENISNISYYPSSQLTYDRKKCLTISREESQVIFRPLNRKVNKFFKPSETVSEKIQKLIRRKGQINKNRLSLSTKLNLDTNLSLSDESENESNAIQ